MDLVTFVCSTVELVLWTFSKKRDTSLETQLFVSMAIANTNIGVLWHTVGHLPLLLLTCSEPRDSRYVCESADGYARCTTSER